MMNACFADTFYFLAMLNPHDHAHSKIIEFNKTFSQPIVTTAWVLTELGDAVSHTINRSLFQILLARLESDPRAIIARPTQSLFEQGIALYNTRQDKQWSLTDCISFVVMQQYGLSTALTGDQHFEQAGFNALFNN